MSDTVDELKTLLGAGTDLALARELGVERSTVAQWRRRKRLPAIYQEIVDAGELDANRRSTIAQRRIIYGDGPGMYLVRAALAAIPESAFAYPPLTAALIGDHRERLVVNVAQLASHICKELFGRPRCESEIEYEQLVAVLLSNGHAQQLRTALSRATLGEHS